VHAFYLMYACPMSCYASGMPGSSAISTPSRSVHMSGDAAPTDRVGLSPDILLGPAYSSPSRRVCVKVCVAFRAWRDPTFSAFGEDLVGKEEVGEFPAVFTDVTVRRIRIGPLDPSPSLVERQTTAQAYPWGFHRTNLPKTVRIA
jgi:hypothetical protein